MPLLFKMQMTLVTFSFTLLLKARILDIPKDAWYDIAFEERGEKFTCKLFTGLEHEKKDKVQVCNKVKC